MPSLFYWENNMINQRIYTDEKGNWRLVNTWDASPYIRHAKMMREMDPWVGEHKGGRRLGCIPQYCWDDPSELKLQLAKEAERSGDRDNALKYIKEWFRDNPEFCYVDKL